MAIATLFVVFLFPESKTTVDERNFDLKKEKNDPQDMILLIIYYSERKSKRWVGRTFCGG
jgi:hypothetical protein